MSREINMLDENVNKSGIWIQAAIGIVMAIAAGGTSPWWWGKVIGGNLLSQTASPSSPAKLSLPEIYEYKSLGKPYKFVHVSDKVWKQKDEFGKEFNTFKEIDRDSNFITIYDKSRGIKTEIPVEGGDVVIYSEKVDSHKYYVTKIPNIYAENN
jgi:hypothetical protein